MIRAVGGNIRARWVVVEHARGQVVRMLYLARPKDLQAWSELATVATYSLKRIEVNAGMEVRHRAFELNRLADVASMNSHSRFRLGRVTRVGFAC